MLGILFEFNKTQRLQCLAFEKNETINRPLHWLVVYQGPGTKLHP